MSNKVDNIINIEIGDLVVWDWLTAPEGKKYALGHVGIVLDVWETKYSFAVEVAWAGNNNITIFKYSELLVISKYRDIAGMPDPDVTFVWDEWPEKDD